MCNQEFAYPTAIRVMRLQVAVSAAKSFVDYESLIKYATLVQKLFYDKE